MYQRSEENVENDAEVAPAEISELGDVYLMFAQGARRTGDVSYISKALLSNWDELKYAGLEREVAFPVEKKSIWNFVSAPLLKGISWVKGRTVWLSVRTGCNPLQPWTEWGSISEYPKFRDEHGSVAKVSKAVE